MCVCVWPDIKWPWVTGFLIAKLGDHGKLRGEVFQVVALFLHVALRNEPATLAAGWHDLGMRLRKLDGKNGKNPWCVL